ncbi:general transcription factor IIE subunit 1-like [Narcine bancroftii]|uniref:general transcription factor IIE subunit 1-like n=1 Tax=Narcine bancroftii TaxID=1343680 RepID=UPI0038322A5E
MTDPDVVTEVPAALKRLAKYVVRGFYGLEHALALDILIRNPCVKEEDMLELLKFDRKQLRAVLNTLKNDKFIKSRMRVETAPDGKSTRHNYYFINYRLLVNVVKYKLDHMRRRIETDERDSTNRASFKCPNCFKTFTDLEANQLFDLMTGTFRCTFCQTEVEEDESALPKKDARTLLARFNEQIEPIYALLRETEDVNLAHEILEPEPTEIPSLRANQRAPGAGSGSMNSPKETWANRGPTYEDLYTQKVIINMEESDVQHRVVSDGKPVKERPIWMRESTVRGAFADSEELQEGDSFHDCDGKENPMEANEEVMQTLLIHEKKSTSATVAAAVTIPTSNASDSESDTSESEDDSPRPQLATVSFPVAAEEDEEFEDEPTVLVAGQPYSYSQVSQCEGLVAQMTAEEKETYIAMGQRIFQDMYE